MVKNKPYLIATVVEIFEVELCTTSKNSTGARFHRQCSIIRASMAYMQAISYNKITMNYFMCISKIMITDIVEQNILLKGSH